jgi:hypothetical protein
LRLLLVATALIAVTAGVSYAAIPGAGGAIDGCFEKRTGLLRVIDTEAGKRCTQWETAIQWNQKGLKGDQGLPGPKGDKGDPGTPAPLYTAGEGIELVGTQFRVRPLGITAAQLAMQSVSLEKLAFDPATQAELDAESSNRSTQVAQLQSQVTQLQSQNQTQSQQVASLQAQVNALAARVTALEGQ